MACSRCSSRPAPKLTQRRATTVTRQRLLTQLNPRTQVGKLTYTSRTVKVNIR